MGFEPEEREYVSSMFIRTMDEVLTEAGVRSITTAEYRSAYAWMEKHQWDADSLHSDNAVSARLSGVASAMNSGITGLGVWPGTA